MASMRVLLPLQAVARLCVCPCERCLKALGVMRVCCLFSSWSRLGPEVPWRELKVRLGPSTFLQLGRAPAPSLCLAAGRSWGRGCEGQAGQGRV